MDQDSAAEIIYPDLYKGLNLRAEDLTPYSSLLVSFEGKIIIQKGQIRLPMQIGSEVVEVDFIVVDAYSSYIAIVTRPWLHTLEVVSSTLHQKVKYPSEDQIKEILGISLWQGNAWWQPSNINPRPSPRLIKRRACSS